ncbi:mechanosensitive ion channel family protein [Chitinivibrio alkaliphilus]|uniref:Mechanosensitive ion channel protein MscS n=1 Tax=Chitinivibrio alkaliphilus ACht1 TaxID=1313304 RepID=U7D8I7_9BACT|nr:mechanosensitive ion channel family protein [Chitinivibrio alkaliphilus]ERP31866.1 mechanosensitive ion channel protein MscS [Chitinivibrio alkaliphilus ACht1]
MESYQEMVREYSDIIVQWSISTLPMIILICIISWVAIRLSRSVISRLYPIVLKNMTHGSSSNEGEEEKRLETLLGILKSLVKVGIFAIAGMLILKEVGVDIAPLIAGAGIIGLGLGFGSQELVRDFISGFFILMENHIRKGDVVNINGTGGLVQQVGLRTIVLRDVSGVVHVFQNGKINSFSNLTKEWSAAVLTIGVAYKEDLDAVMDVMRTVGEELAEDEEFGPAILEPIEIMGVDNFGDSAIDIRLRIKTRPIEQWKTAREYRRRLKRAFDEHNIEIPFPHRTVYWGSEIESLKIANES